MSKENPNNRENHIYLYADDFKDESTWVEVCEWLNISPDEMEVRINYDDNDVYVEEPEGTVNE